jgi:hypothetical protein
MSPLKRTLIIAFLPVATTLVTFCLTNLVARQTAFVDADSRFTDRIATCYEYGFPKTYRTWTESLENPGDIFGDGGTIRAPRNPPARWQVEETFDGDDLQRNIEIWGAFALAFWLVVAGAWMFIMKLKEE